MKTNLSWPGLPSETVSKYPKINDWQFQICLDKYSPLSGTPPIYDHESDQKRLGECCEVTFIKEWVKAFENLGTSNYSLWDNPFDSKSNLPRKNGELNWHSRTTLEIGPPLHSSFWNSSNITTKYYYTLTAVFDFSLNFSLFSWYSED